MADIPMIINRRISTGIPTSYNQANTKTAPVSTESFHEFYQQTLQRHNNQIKFSKHAEYRIRDRNICLTSEDIDKIGKAVQMASSKGVKDTLIVYDKLAFIVNIPNKTIVTAFDGDQLKENIFTNIDGAVII